MARDQNGPKGLDGQDGLCGLNGLDGPRGVRGRRGLGGHGEGIVEAWILGGMGVGEDLAHEAEESEQGAEESAREANV